VTATSAASAPPQVSTGPLADAPMRGQCRGCGRPVGLSPKASLVVHHKGDGDAESRYRWCSGTGHPPRDAPAPCAELHELADEIFRRLTAIAVSFNAHVKHGTPQLEDLIERRAQEIAATRLAEAAAHLAGRTHE
jgi:hypothetical protein